LRVSYLQYSILGSLSTYLSVGRLALWTGKTEKVIASDVTLKYHQRFTPYPNFPLMG
jgi:hypothetical protein